MTRDSRDSQFISLQSGTTLERPRFDQASAKLVHASTFNCSIYKLCLGMDEFDIISKHNTMGELNQGRKDFLSSHPWSFQDQVAFVRRMGRRQWITYHLGVALSHAQSSKPILSRPLHCRKVWEECMK